MSNKRRGEARELLANRYVLFCCEGICERVILSRLIEGGRLLVSSERIVYDTMQDTPYTGLRSGKDIEERFLRGKRYAVDGVDELVIARIFDSSRENLRLKSLYRERVRVLDFLTKPEIEMLVIARENVYDDWTNAKRNAQKKGRQLHASEFCSEFLDIGYNKSWAFHQEYWRDDSEVIDAIERYVSKLGGRKHDNLTLADLLK